MANSSTSEVRPQPDTVTTQEQKHEAAPAAYVPHVLGSWLGAAGCADFGSPLPSPAVVPAWDSDGDVPSFLPLPPARQTSDPGSRTAWVPQAPPCSRWPALGAAVCYPSAEAKGERRQRSTDSSELSTPAAPAWPNTPDFFYLASPKLPPEPLPGLPRIASIARSPSTPVSEHDGAGPHELTRVPSLEPPPGLPPPQVIHIPMLVPHKCRHCGHDCVPPQDCLL